MTVYFIQAGEGGPIKIGLADDVAARLMELQVGNHECLTVLRTVDGNRSVERWFHRHFADKRLRGEWFRRCDSMLSLNPPEIVGRPPIDRFSAVIGLWDNRSSIAADCETTYGVVQQWERREFIPGAYWMAVIAGAARRGLHEVTFDLLARLAAEKRRTAEPERRAS